MKIKKLLFLVLFVVIGVVVFLIVPKNTKKGNIETITNTRYVYVIDDGVLKVIYEESYSIENNELVGKISSKIVDIITIKESISEYKSLDIKGLDINEGIKKIKELNNSIVIYYTSPYFENDTIVNYYFETINDDYFNNDKYVVVLFDSDGGSIVSSYFININEKAKKPGNPKKSGYTFVEWQLNGKKYDFDTEVTKDIILKASYTKNIYEIEASIVDAMSPDRTIAVYEDDVKISFKEIKYTDGVLLCKGSNPAVSKSDLYGETEFIVVLEDGVEVTATLK